MTLRERCREFFGCTEELHSIECFPWGPDGADLGCEALAAFVEGEVADLTRRLAESESAAEDQARLVGMGSEREARLLAERDAARERVRAMEASLKAIAAARRGR